MILILLPLSTTAQKLNMEDFEAYAKQAKESGFTHIKITYDIPVAMWQYDVPDDPYPAWYAFRPSLLKIFPPENLQPYVDMEYASEIIDVFKARMEIARRYGLKGYYRTNEPHVLPEAFFKEYPHLRGPRVDQVNRSRTARFSPDVDRPEVQQMYKEAMQRLLETLPDVEVFSFVTTDAGSGLCWSEGLYPGKNGPAFCKHRSMKERVQDFMMALHEGASAAGVDIKLNMYGIPPRQWMEDTFGDPAEIAKGLPDGFSVEGFTNDGDRIKWRRPSDGYAFYEPIYGIPNPMGTAGRIVDDLNNAKTGTPLGAKFPREPGLDFKFRLQKKLMEVSPENSTEIMVALREFATDLAGEEHADDLMMVWEGIHNAEEHLSGLNFGPVFRMGHILGRWVNRPMVPYPEDLTAGEKSYYEPYLFQAKEDEQVNNLIDIQAMRMYEGYGARLLVQRVTELMMDDLNSSREALSRIIEGSESETKRNEWILLDTRLAVLQSFTRTLDNMVGYQALLELAKNDANEPEENPVLGAKNSWKRQELLRIARDEIDNTIELRELLLSTDIPLIHTASSPDGETIMMLSPDLPDQLKKKINIMNSKWLDYDRLFTRPNP